MRRYPHYGRSSFTYWISSRLAFSFSIIFLTITPTYSEWYIAAQAGLPLPGTLSDAKLTSPTLAGGVNDARVSNIEYGVSPLYGAKIGYFPPKRDWLGVEADLFVTQVNVRQQTLTGGVAGST